MRFWTLLTLIPLLTSCASKPDIPPWFDGIQRHSIKTTLVQGSRIAYLDHGDGPPVILIHGFGGAMWQWEYQQTALAARHRVITVDLPGSGLSDRPDIAYTPDDMIRLFTGFMDALHIPRASLVGNSLGSGLVEAMALVHPERVDRLVLISGFPDRVHDRLTSPMIRDALETRLPVWLLSLGNLLSGRGVTVKILKEMIHDDTLLTPLVVERSYRNRKRPGVIPPMMALARNLSLWEDGLAKRLGEIRHPTLIVWGDQDEVFPPQTGRDLRAIISTATLEMIPEAGHIPMWEQPNLVNPLLVKFLQP